MKKALELLNHYQGIFDMYMFYNISIREDAITFQGWNSKLKQKYFETQGYIFSYPEGYNEMLCGSIIVEGIEITIVLTIN